MLHGIPLIQVDYKGVEAWREVLVDWDAEGPHYLRFVSAKGKTGASEAVTRWLPQLASHGDRVQICLDGMEILQSNTLLSFFPSILRSF